jgi:hypothetical protein
MKRLRIIVTVGISGGGSAHAAVSPRPPIPPHDCSPYSHVHVRRGSLGFVHRSRTSFCRPAPNPNDAIRNFLHRCTEGARTVRWQRYFRLIPDRPRALMSMRFKYTPLSALINPAQHTAPAAQRQHPPGCRTGSMLDPSHGAIRSRRWRQPNCCYTPHTPQCSSALPLDAHVRRAPQGRWREPTNDELVFVEPVVGSGVGHRRQYHLEHSAESGTGKRATGGKQRTPSRPGHPTGREDPLPPSLRFPPEGCVPPIDAAPLSPPWQSYTPSFWTCRTVRWRAPTADIAAAPRPTTHRQLAKPCSVKPYTGVVRHTRADCATRRGQ